jgi:hypothetical protein
MREKSFRFLALSISLALVVDSPTATAASVPTIAVSAVTSSGVRFDAEAFSIPAAWEKLPFQSSGVREARRIGSNLELETLFAGQTNRSLWDKVPPKAMARLQDETRERRARDWMAFQDMGNYPKQQEALILLHKAGLSEKGLQSVLGLIRHASIRPTAENVLGKLLVFYRIRGQEAEPTSAEWLKLQSRDAQAMQMILDAVAASGSTVVEIQQAVHIYDSVSKTVKQKGHRTLHWLSMMTPVKARSVIHSAIQNMPSSLESPRRRGRPRRTGQNPSQPLVKGTMIDQIAAELGVPTMAVRIPNELDADGIEDLGLSVRTFTHLRNANIRTIGDFLSRTEGEILRTKHFGKKSLDEAKAAAKNFLATIVSPDAQAVRALSSAFGEQEALALFIDEAGKYGFKRFELLTAQNAAETRELIGVKLKKGVQTGNRWRVNEDTLVVYRHFGESISEVFQQEKRIDLQTPKTKAIIQALLRIENARVKRSGPLFDALEAKVHSRDALKHALATQSYLEISPTGSPRNQIFQDIAQVVWFVYVFRSPRYRENHADETTFNESTAGDVRVALETDFPWLNPSVANDIVNRILELDKNLDPLNLRAPEEETLFAGQAAGDIPTAEDVQREAGKTRTSSADNETLFAGQSVGRAAQNALFDATGVSRSFISVVAVFTRVISSLSGIPPWSVNRNKGLLQAPRKYAAAA